MILTIARYQIIARGMQVGFVRLYSPDEQFPKNQELRARSFELVVCKHYLSPAVAV